jgi:hypothetical protein
MKKKEFLIGLCLLVLGFFVLAHQAYSFASHKSILTLAPIQAPEEAQVELPLTPLFGAVAMFAGVVLIVRDRDRAS